MGRVWRATDVVLHREVAIKELVPPPGLTPAERQEMRERSLREARAIARLNNINVVRVFDVLRTDADPWIVMEYVPSRSLQDTLAKDGPFNAVRTAEIGLGVLNALKAAHRAGVVHRDVKPGNVLMGGDGRVVLTDFGLATVPGDPNVTRTGLVLGSPAYIAPERARDGTAGPAADLWSLGATLYAAVEGQSPFARPSAIATLAALATENVPQARNAGPLKPVLNGLLRKDPAHRIDADEAERLLARAAGRRSKISFPMSPTMRRPGVGRERPSLPSGPGGPPVLPGSGFVTATGSAPVVPTPRPRPADAPAAGGPEQPGGRPVFTPGKATVGNPVPPTAPARPGQRPQDQAKPPRPLDRTKVDGPPVRDEPANPTAFGTRTPPPAAPRGTRPGSGTTPAGRATPVEPQRAVPPSSPVVNTARVGFTAADVAANRRKKAAPEHEASLAAATGAYPVVPEPAEAVEATPATPEPEAVETPAEAPEQPAVVAESEPAEPEAKPAASAETEEPAVGEAAGTGSDEAEDAPAEDQAEARTESPADKADDQAAEAEAAEVEAGEAEAGEAEAGQAEAGQAEADQADQDEKRAEPVKAAAEPSAEMAGETADADEGRETEEAEAKAEPVAPPVPIERPATPLTPGQRPAPTIPVPDQDKTSVVDFTAIVPQSPVAAGDADGATRVVTTLPTAGGFAPSQRPAWTPMPVRPVVRRVNGITVFGTTLTRRQAVVGAAIVLTFVLLVGIILVQAFGKDDDKASGTTPAAVATGKSPAVQQPGKAATSTPSPSVTPAKSSAPAIGAVPANWKSTSFSGYSLALPPGADVENDRDGAVKITWPKRLVYVFRFDGDMDDPVQAWEEADRPSGYQKIGITPVTYQGRPAADWEYYYNAPSGTRMHVVKRGFAVGGKTYQICWYTEPDDWEAAKKEREALFAGFKVD